MTTVAIMQPTYLGWCGYFDLLDQADVFVLLDTVAISRQSWQTRNRIRARDGNVVWLSVPNHSHLGDMLNDVQMAGGGWQSKHMRTLDSAYSHAPFWDTVRPAIASVKPPDARLSRYTYWLIWKLADVLGITHDMFLASTFLRMRGDDPIARIAEICRQAKATEYLSPAGARDYLEGHDIGVPIRWHNYEHPVYDQGGAEFMPYLSVVDLIAWHGPRSLEIIRSGRA